MKNKFKTIIIVIVLLWLVSFFSAKLMSNGFKADIVGNGIAVIPIHGMIGVNDGDGFFEKGVSASNIVDSLERTNKNNGIKAVILDINSGGGAVVATREIVRAVEDINKPVVALIRDAGASGAYWIASSSDWIIADELSVTGSIGVYSSYLEFSGLLERYNVSYERLTAGEYKDVGVPYRKLGNIERNMMQQKLDLIHDLFIKEVAENRNLNKSEVKKLADGFFVLGIEAKEKGLVDQLGGKKEAVAKAKELSGLKDGNLIEYKEKANLIDILKKFQNKAFYSMGRGIGVSLVGVEDELKIVV